MSRTVRKYYIYYSILYSRGKRASLCVVKIKQANHFKKGEEEAKEGVARRMGWRERSYIYLYHEELISQTLWLSQHSG